MQNKSGEYSPSAPQSTAIIANGEIKSYKIIKPMILAHSQIIAVDGGLLHCEKMGIKPHKVVGDFDSCPMEIVKKYTSVVTLNTDKDETDLEAAIQEAEEGAITLFGAWGHRIDHSLTNALLLCRYPGMKMQTETEEVFAIDAEVKLECKIGQTLSLIPICGPVTGIDTDGLKWELKNGMLDQNFIGISNVCQKTKVAISVKIGILLCVLIHK